MNVNKQKLDEALKNDHNIRTMLINLFEYSVKDINGYDELTATEKEIMSEERFNKFVN